jgi:DnaJ-class molecular chaperone
MPKLNAPTSRGDLFARVKVRLPAKLDAQQRELFEELKAKGL